MNRIITYSIPFSVPLSTSSSSSTHACPSVSPSCPTYACVSDSPSCPAHTCSSDSFSCPTHAKSSSPSSSVHGGLTVKTFLQSLGYSNQNIIMLKKTPSGLTVNGQEVYVNHPLSAGDILTVSILEDTSSEKIIPLELPVNIVYEDEDLLVVNKPAGMPIHPSLNNYDNSLANALAWYFQQQGIPFIFRCINRLDRDTSGLTIIAKHIVSAGILSSMAARRELHREYLAIVRGTVNPPQGTIDAPIGRRPDSIMERMIDWEQGERAVTHYQTLRIQNGYSLISLCLETGRTHQIRVHMQHLGYPLIGDFLYNPDMEVISRQALHSYRLAFRHPITGADMTFTAPLPEDMKQVLSPLQNL